MSSLDYYSFITIESEKPLIIILGTGKQCLQKNILSCIKGRGTRDSLDHGKSKRVPEKHLLLLY